LPSRSLTTGRAPAAIASSSDSDVESERDADRNTSARASHPASSAGSIRPVKVTRPAGSVRPASASSDARREPSPATTSRVWGRDSITGRTPANSVGRS
jgi:hypothetical protein